MTNEFQNFWRDFKKIGGTLRSLGDAEEVALIMKDIVTKYRAVIEDCELLLGDNNNLKNMSRNDIDEICRYVIVDIYKESAELTIIALVNIYIKAMIVKANADYDILREYLGDFLYYDGTTSSYRYIRAKLKEIKGIMEQGIDDKYLYRNYEEIVDVLEGFLEDLEAKYDKMKINLRKNYY